MAASICAIEVRRRAANNKTDTSKKSKGPHEYSLNETYVKIFKVLFI